MGAPHVYKCKECNTHLTTYSDIISKAFRGRTGRAFLYQRVVNVEFGPQEERLLTTGLHTVRDVFCKICHRNVGWKYDDAFEKNQKYKIGKFCIEKALTISEKWDVSGSPKDPSDHSAVHRELLLPSTGSGRQSPVDLM